jgi:hypothetical protein
MKSKQFQIVPTDLGKCTKNVYIVNVNPQQYDICSVASQNMWANKKKGRYGSGLLNTKEDPYKTERTGRLGEMAFGILINQNIDAEYKHLGDTQDFTINNKKFDIKTAAKKPKYLCGLIRAQTESGKFLDLTSDTYVFGYVILDDILKKVAQISLVGYMNKGDIIKLEMKPAKMGFHKNYEIPYKDTQDIGDLI